MVLGIDKYPRQLVLLMKYALVIGGTAITVLAAMPSQDFKLVRDI